jgi:hypothetical protein
VVPGVNAVSAGNWRIEQSKDRITDAAISSARNAELGYRFDERPGHQPQARFVDDYVKVVIEEPAEVVAFVNELATAKSLYVLIRSLNAGRTSAEFQLEGAPEAIKAALGTCPVGQPLARR